MTPSADVQRITLPQTGHFAALERPEGVTRILINAVSIC
jgi:hypothetical protein